MENNGVRYKVGDYVDFRIAEDKFRGTILALISETKGGTPTKAKIEVSASTKKSAEVSVSIMEVNLTQLSPLL